MEKIKNLRDALTEKGLDALLVTSTYNRRYLTNFTGSSGVALITKDKALFITDFRYVEQATTQCEGFEIVKHEGLISSEVAAQIKNHGLAKVGFEQDYMTFSEYGTYRKVVTSAELVPVNGMVENLRLIKTDAEISIIKEATKIAESAFDHILGYIRPGVTELEVSNELEFYMRKLGATSSSFDIIVASGARSALPHGVASSKVIETGDFVTLDFGAYYNGYVSDMTRTVSVGEPAAELKKIYDIVLEAQLRGVNGIKAGIKGKEADALTRDYITEKGYGEYYGHSTGHGIGLEVHEGPGLSFRSDLVLEPNMIVTCEPGIYIPNLGGVRIEDDLIVKNGGNENLMSSPKNLIIL